MCCWMIDREGICVIDLDTVMPGLAAYDFGDMVRTMTCAAAEDEHDLSRVTMDFDCLKRCCEDTWMERELSDFAGAQIADHWREGHRLRAGNSIPGGLSRGRHVLQGEPAGTESRPMPHSVQTAGFDRAAGGRDDATAACAGIVSSRMKPGILSIAYQIVAHRFYRYYLRRTLRRCSTSPTTALRMEERADCRGRLCRRHHLSSRSVCSSLCAYGYGRCVSLG